ncbi:hypothetical protein Q5752_000008 [Cryptotrichosporon argae]
MPLNILPALQAVPASTRILSLLLVAFSAAHFALAYLVAQNSPAPPRGGAEVPWLTMRAAESWKYPWTLLTAGFVELNVVEVIFSLLTLPLAARYLERAWGPRELLRFSAIVIVGSNVIAFGFSWLSYIMLGQEDAIYGLPYHGLSGLQSGFLVAFTQLIPEHQVQLFGAIKMRVKTLPGVYLLISNVLVIALGPSPYILVQFGFFVAWVYLRFFKLSEDGAYRGDRSETFAFQYWFPPVIRPYIAIAANHVFRLAVRFKLVTSWDEPVGGYSLPGPGSARAEAERRRALALKALDARLASSSPAPTTPAPASTSAPAAPEPARPALNTAVSREDKVKD